MPGSPRSRTTATPTGSQEKTNVQSTWQLVPEEEAEGRLNLMLASGEIPEMIFGIVTPSQQALYGAQGLFLPLNDLIEEHAPNLKKAFEIYPGMRETLTAPDGNIYGMLTLEDCYHCSMSQKLWIYQPWLDALGLEMPTDHRRVRAGAARLQGAGPQRQRRGGRDPALDHHRAPTAGRTASTASS